MKNDETKVNSHDMQLLQADFDKSRGFHQLPFPPNAIDDKHPLSFSDKLSMAEFAAIGLGGEVGELLNGLKKIRRNLAINGIETFDPQALLGEVADVYSYLLKLSNILGHDLEVAYLEKMCLNRYRFPALEKGQRPAFIIAGPPGSGKSSVSAALERMNRKGRTIYIEDFSQNPFLLDAISQGSSVFESQEWFLEKVRSFLAGRSSEKSVTVIDQSPLAIPLVYGHDFYAGSILGRSDYLFHLQNYLRLHGEFDSAVSSISTIYLTADIDTLMHRCSAKGFVDRDWLVRIVERFHIIRDLSEVCIDTTGMSLDEVVLRVESLIED
ncbi:hypothetical protein GFL78_08900 [Rhizobium leguminosarum bv. viciae]|nr:hypothetical protein [Rhizobium leguminosarum bv. viciae]